MLGKGSCYADLCKSEGFIGVDFLNEEDLTNNLHEDWHDFNKQYIPIWLNLHPDKKRVAAGLACGNLWTVCKGLQIDDIILSPNGKGEYYVGKITSNYFYKKGEPLPHRRKVEWLSTVILRSEMSEQLQRSTNSIGTCCEITSYHEEIDGFINKQSPTTIIATTPDVEDVSEFALEKHLEDFLVKNWKQTESAVHSELNMALPQQNVAKCCKHYFDTHDNTLNYIIAYDSHWQHHQKDFRSTRGLRVMACKTAMLRQNKHL